MLRLDLFNIMTHKQIHAFAKHLWPEQEILFDNTRSEDLVRKFFSECDTSNSGTFSRLSATFSIALYGSDFDLSVWLKTTKIPPGQTMSYQELASLCGCPKGARAIGNALARNRFAYVIPCHRIVRKDGLVGNYRWNQNRKEQLLAWENQNNLYNEQHSHLEN
jgi:AraC family transcriptional regulator of adaptative response/methylated-DNA-[protein]-cysteine methyltransferase